MRLAAGGVAGQEDELSDLVIGETEIGEGGALTGIAFDCGGYCVYRASYVVDTQIYPGPAVETRKRQTIAKLRSPSPLNYAIHSLE